MRDWPVAVIPNALDLYVFKPIDRQVARAILNLPMDENIVMYGALGGSADPRKGWDLLAPALVHLAQRRANLKCVVLGEREPKERILADVPTTWLGHVSDDYTLALLYSAADVVVVPSRQENLPQVATEAQACGCPVVSFNVGGLADVVSHCDSGYLVNDLSSEALARGIEWVLDDTGGPRLGEFARRKALSEWGEMVVSRKYAEIFREVRSENTAA
jgi:glycosyltransferase involved in cell wall biosynthesis